MTIVEHSRETESIPPTYAEAPAGIRHRLFTVDEYVKMGEVGILDPEERVELLDGEIVPMSPIGSRHSIIASLIANTFAVLFHDRKEFFVIGQGPTRLSWLSMPQPDVAVVNSRVARGEYRHPEPDDVYLVIEVSETTLKQDLGVKCTLYAKAGIKEYWVVDLTSDRLIVHRAPELEKGTYAEVREVRAGDSLRPVAWPDVTIQVSDLLTPS